MIELLCISDLHLGEEYAFLNYGNNWDWDDQTKILPLYNGVAQLAKLTVNHEPKVKVKTLVLLGDIFELSTARIETAAQAGRNFFYWLFQWLCPERIIFVPGNHDHVFWIWWCVSPGNDTKYWWDIDPGDAKSGLTSKYKELSNLVSDPYSPEGTQKLVWREELIRFFFGREIDPSLFYLCYPAYIGPRSGPAGFRNRPFLTFFTHGHFNDPTFVRPLEAGLVSRGMHWLVKEAPKTVDMSDLESVERTTWEYTNRFWYPPEKETSWNERLYLMSVFFNTGNPCLHPLSPAPQQIEEPAADLERTESSNNDFYNLTAAALGANWYLQPVIYVYGHTHHGGAMSIDPSFMLFNTGGWLKKTADQPPHTHLFAINLVGTARMIRTDFE